MEQMLSLEILNNVSEIDVVYKKRVNVKVSERPLIQTSADCYKVFIHYWDQGKIDLLEEFKVLFLSKSNRVLQIYAASSGGITGTVADSRLILAAVIKVAACHLIVGDNHPSGSLKPSRADEELTQKLKQAARLLDIMVLDHVSIKRHGRTSPLNH